MVLAFLLGFQAPMRKGLGSAVFIFLPVALLNSFFAREAGNTVLAFLALVLSVVAVLKERLGGEAGAEAEASPSAPPSQEQGSGT